MALGKVDTVQYTKRSVCGCAGGGPHGVHRPEGPRRHTGFFRDSPRLTFSAICLSCAKGGRCGLVLGTRTSGRSIRGGTGPCAATTSHERSSLSRVRPCSAHVARCSDGWGTAHRPLRPAAHAMHTCAAPAVCSTLAAHRVPSTSVAFGSHCSAPDLRRVLPFSLAFVEGGGGYVLPPPRRVPPHTPASGFLFVVVIHLVR